jgi:hypothetical protein
MRTELPCRILNTVGLIAILATGSSASSTAADLGTKHGIQWSPAVEWTVANPAWSRNPFDVVATVEFTHDATGATRRTEMFYAGARSWAFRFAGTKPGTWTFVTTSVDEDLRRHTGKVEIAPNPRVGVNGFLRRLGGRWGWEATEEVFVPQLVMWDYVAGGNSPKLFHDKPELVDGKIDEFLVDHGFNGFHIPVIGGRWFDMEAASSRVAAFTTRLWPVAWPTSGESIRI